MLTIDARGLKCPLPALKAEKQAARLTPGQSFELLATDPMARIDIPHFCAANGYEVEVREADGLLTFRIARPADL